jgi:hypothetical protein
MEQSVAQVVSEVQLAFDNANAQIVLDCINRVHRDLCSEFALYKSTTQINLVDGQREYDLDRDVMSVRVVTYLPNNSGAYEILMPQDVSELDRTTPGWRRLAKGAPKNFYIDAGKIGFFPTPNVTTIGGYPVVEIETTNASVLGMGDMVPSAIRSSRVYSLGARRYYAELDAKDQVEFYDQLYQRELMDLERILGRRNRNYRHKITPSTASIASQI